MGSAFGGHSLPGFSRPAFGGRPMPGFVGSPFSGRSVPRMGFSSSRMPAAGLAPPVGMRGGDARSPFGASRGTSGRASGFPGAGSGSARDSFFQPHSGQFHGHDHGHGHVHDQFVFFFTPLFVGGFALPYAYYAPFYDSYPYDYPPDYSPEYSPDYPPDAYGAVPDDALSESSPDEQAPPAEESGYEPSYGDWTRSTDGNYFVCPYYLTPQNVLTVLAYPGQQSLAYYYDPRARQFIGVLDRSSGNFRHWYASEKRWSPPVQFPFEMPPPLDESTLD